MGFGRHARASHLSREVVSEASSQTIHLCYIQVMALGELVKFCEYIVLSL